MSRFTPAQSQTAARKILVYGAPGVGKSLLLASFARVGRLAVIACERGIADYATRYPFQIAQVATLAEAKSALLDAATDPAFEVIALDSLSPLWAGLQPATALTKGDWGPIKRQWDQFRAALDLVQKHVVMSAHEHWDDPKTHRAACDKDTAHVPDLLLRMALVGKERTLEVRKARYTTLAVGTIWPAMTGPKLLETYHQALITPAPQPVTQAAG